MKNILPLKDIRVSKGKQTILDITAFTVDKGEVVTIIGPNGAGKSSLLQVMALLERPMAGQVIFAGRPCRTEKERVHARRRMAVVFQEPLLLDGTVLHNVTLGLTLRGVGKSEAKERAAAWLQKFGVEHLMKQHVRHLSGGEAQRISLARAFAAEPEVLFLDEPFTSLDAPTKVTLMEQLARMIQTTHVTAIFVTHEADGIPDFGNRVVVMENGRLQRDEKLSELKRRLNTPFLQAFFGNTP